MRFNQMLLILMGIAAMSAFAMPPSFGERFRGTVAGLFWPVAYPVRQIAGAMDARFVKPQNTPSSENDAARSLAQLHAENEALRQQITFLIGENEQLRTLADIRTSLGPPGKYCIRVPVSGGDVGNQQVLNLQIHSSEAVAPNMPVLYAHGYIGKLEPLGLGSARVRLITDAASRTTGAFYRSHSDAGLVQLPQEPKVMEGRGDGTMIIRGLKIDEVQPPGHRESWLTRGDWVVVNDKDLPSIVQKQKLGEIEAIKPGKKSMFVDIIVRPDEDLMKLRDVLVMNKR